VFTGIARWGIIGECPTYVGQVRRAKEKPAAPPVQQPTKFEFVINVGLTVAPILLAPANEVIE
jgi:hypothetical protein